MKIIEHKILFRPIRANTKCLNRYLGNNDHKDDDYGDGLTMTIKNQQP